ncbi:MULTISPECIES: hypothetical protein [Enterobacter]|uniref:hypothetical protein n=1 Tax=Enterobacter TaxID=547 RepID=UPI000F822C9A|nr:MULTISPECIES: hypothetical protein [Enterobacter]MBE3288358.1 hypothetical protein [Enterobacter cloacae complex sp. P31C]RTM28423.1 hypothetical protein EKO14_16885 [Enterobacter bugandensis]
MFEITGAQVADLNDADLRTLVARLALAELRAQGCPSSSVTAGGNQDAADGGLDVRVECPSALLMPDFVPRQHTGFQVKKPDMPASAIRDEMRPGGVLRPVIAELAARSGAYIIVSAQGSVADKPLSDRRDAIRAQLDDLPEAGQLHSDFYDRDRLATWVNHYPGIAAWVRTRLGIGMSGWSSIGDWCGVGVSEETPYLFNDKACLTDERTSDREQLTIGEGIARLRVSLTKARQCIRLIGLSGLGKTRLVQALFEDGVGEVPLDPGLAVYTDYSAETDPTARDMARQLVIARQRAILIVDNCNPATHNELARICSEKGSQVSLLTVEYDVRDDEPERTEVFRLQSASSEIVELWLEKTFPNVTQVDRRTISEFSDGNFRVARALADTLGKGETLGKLKSRDLFERIFHQRNEPDRDLFSAAEDLALLYSIDGEDTSEGGELARVAAIRGVPVATIYAALNTLRQRGIAQLRGRWRAILPHAIANPLAGFALERMPSADFDRFCASLTTRMQKSLSRRLGYLHDSAEARAVVERWLRADGPLGDLAALGDDGLQIIANIAPVAPDTVLARIERDVAGPDGGEIIDPQSSNRWQWIRLIKHLAYDPPLFDRAATLLARFLSSESPAHHNNSASGMFAELFHLHLSGTKALPDQRRALVRRFAQSGDPALARCAGVALDALLKAHHFSSFSDFDFGARSRDYGWHPPTYGDIWAWYNGAVDLAVELSPIIENARDHLAHSIRNLWHFGACHDALERAATHFSSERPWIEGWIGFRTALRFEGDAMPNEVRARLVALIERLKPTDLLHQARAVVLGRNSFGWDVADGDADDGDVMKPYERASQQAKEIGTALAHDPETRAAFIAELFVEQNPQRAYECGIGLSDGATDLDAMWCELLDLFSAAEADSRNAMVLGGFIHGAHAKDSAFANSTLENVIQNPDLAASLPYLQARVAIDTQGIARLRRAIERGVLSAWNFQSIANGSVAESPPDALGLLLTDIGNLADGVEIALDILHMHFYRDREEGRQRAPSLIAVGRELLLRADYRKKQSLRDFGLNTVIRVCCAGPDGEATLREICARVRAGLETVYLSSYDLGYVLKALFETHPLIALDEFLLPELRPRNRGLFEGDFGSGTPVENVGAETLVQWANIDPDRRYPLLGKSIPMFKRQQGEEENGVSTLFLEILGHAPDKRAFLGDIWSRLHPPSWSGSLADILVRRRAAITTLGDNVGGEVRQWVTDMLPELERWIEHESKRDREGEQSFE